MKATRSSLPFSALLLLLAACSSGSDSPSRSSNADLSALIPSRGTLVPSFTPENTSYSVDVAMAVEQIALTGIKSDEDATVSSNNGLLEALGLGAN